MRRSQVCLVGAILLLFAPMLFMVWVRNPPVPAYAPVGQERTMRGGQWAAIANTQQHRHASAPHGAPHALEGTPQWRPQEAATGVYKGGGAHRDHGLVLDGAEQRGKELSRTTRAGTQERVVTPQGAGTQERADARNEVDALGRVAVERGARAVGQEHRKGPTHTQEKGQEQGQKQGQEKGQEKGREQGRERGQQYGASFSREPYERAEGDWSAQEKRVLLDGHWPWEQEVLGAFYNRTPEWANTHNDDNNSNHPDNNNMDSNNSGGAGQEGAGVEDVSRGVCEGVYKRVQELGSAQLLEAIAAQEQKCGAASYDEWRRLRAVGAARVAANNGTAKSLFLHMEKAAGTMACKLLVGYDKAVGEQNTRPGSQNCNDGGWPERLDYRAAFTERGLGPAPLPCPDELVYWTSVRHPWRRLLSTAQNKKVPLDDVRLCSGGAGHKNPRLYKDYHVSMLVARDDAFPCGGATLDQLLWAEWRWCSLFSGAVYPDESAADTWAVLVQRIFGMPDHSVPHWPRCGAPASTVVKASTPGKQRINRCLSDAAPVPPLRDAWKLAEGAAEEALLEVAFANRHDLELWSVMHATAYSRNIYG
eukprot:TRINITY_DN12789_c0_g1_i1.p2 TRINITY_DN12789_c0_g1~~TRINITY_DN12789_c0_g1_i1.p2  ORF type:complete len:591 (-),score=172.82 TRINITY_DN12789_c0_g1_i1:92-1864(-)